MKLKKILTMDDLCAFCQDNSIQSFSSKDMGYSLSVQIPSTFELDEASATEGLLRLKIYLMHTGLNRNHSYFSKESIQNAFPSFKWRPVLGYIHQLDNGDYDFWTHNYVVEDESTGEVRYLEQQIGSITDEEPFFEYVEKYDKTYACVYAVIPEEYTKAAEIIRRKGGTKNSIEAAIDSFVYNAKEKRLEITGWHLSGTTLLGSNDEGEEIGEGMIGSRADIADFSTDNNSVLPKSSYGVDDKIMEMLEKLNMAISDFNSNISKEGGNKSVSKFEELLEKYGKTSSDIDFDYEDLSDEELEAKFAERFQDDGATDVSEDNSDAPADNAEYSSDDGEEAGSSDNESDDNSDNSENQSDNYSLKTTIEYNGTTKEFALTLDEISWAIYNLVNETYSDDGWYRVEVYDDNTVIMYNYDTNKYYRQSFERNEDQFLLVGERVEVHPTYVTDIESAVLENMKATYSNMEEELKKYKFEDLLSKEEYAVIRENEAVSAVQNELSKYSIDELSGKLDSILLEYIKKNGSNFSYNGNKTPTKKTIFDASKNEKKQSRYGSIFNTK